MQKNGFSSIFLYMILVFLCVGLAVLLYLNYNANKDLLREKAEEQYAEQLAAEPTPTPTPEPTPEPERNTVDIVFAFGGDMIGYEGLTSDARIKVDTDEQSTRDGESESESDSTDTVESYEYDYCDQMAGIADDLAMADVSLCSFSGSMMDSQEYKNYLVAPSFAEALRTTGFTIVNTATDHCLDNGIEGLNATVDVLGTQGLVNLGTFADEDSFNVANGICTKVVNGATFAILSYTWATNGNSAASNSYAVNILTTDYMSDQVTVDYDRLGSDLARARELGVDMIVCCLSWSANNSYYSDVRDDEKAVVDYLCQNGADVIIGGGVKVPQPIELRQVTLEDGSTKNCLVAYALGNLLNCMNDSNTNLSGLLYVNFKRDLDNGEVWIDSVNYRPIFVLDTEDVEDIEEDSAPFRFRLLDIYDTMDRYETVNAGLGEEGDDEELSNDFITRDVYDAMGAGATTLQGIFGAQFDVRNGGVNVLEWAKAQ